MMTLADSGNTMTVLIVALVFLALMIVAVVWNDKYYNKYYESNPIALILVAIFSVCATVTLIMIPAATKQDIAEFNKKEYQEALNSSYTVYVNGSLVDVTKIDINQYQITIDDEEKEVYLTPKN